MAGIALVLALAAFSLRNTAAGEPAADLKPLPGTAALSGTVKAATPFQAAQVYAMNVDKNILFMVYTSGGRYQAVHLLPGNYEVSARKKGLASDVKKITVKPGAKATLDLMMQDVPAGAQQPASSGRSNA